MSKAFMFKKGDKVHFSDDRVLVIDPCYVFEGIGDIDWDDFCDEFFSTKEAGSCIFCYKDIDILISNTFFGDGIYVAKSNLGEVGAFAVDSGVFCLIPESEAINKAPELLVFFNADKNQNHSYYDCACLLRVKSDFATAPALGNIDGAIMVDTRFES